MKVELKEFNNITGWINSLYHDAALKMGLSDSERDILYVLYDQGNGCKQSAFYKETGMTRSTVNSAIRKLEKADILYLKAGEGRNTCVYLTEKGEQYLRDTIERLIEIENRIYRQWSEEERKLFIQLNRRYAHELEQAIQEL